MSVMHQLRSQSDVRQSFWENHPQFKQVRGKRQNQYPADVRMSFVDWVDYLKRSEIITESLAFRVTL